MKCFVSPEEKIRLIAVEKLKSSDLNKDDEKRFGKAKESDSSSGYEIPIEIGKIADKKKWWNRKKGISAGDEISVPSSDFETCPDEGGKINLPFYMESLETGSTLTREKNENGKKLIEIDSDEISTTEREGPSNNLTGSDFETSPSFFVADEKAGGDEKKFSLKRFRRKDRKKSREEEEKRPEEKRPEETTVKELMMETGGNVDKSARKCYPVPWTKKTVRTGSDRELKRNPVETSEATIGKRIAAKFSNLSRNKKKNGTTDECDIRETDVSPAEGKAEEVEGERMEREKETDVEEDSFVRYEMPEPMQTFGHLMNTENSEDPDDGFLVGKTPAEYFDGKADGSAADEKMEGKCEAESGNELEKRLPVSRLTRRPNESPKPKRKKPRNAGKIDSNPLRKMFAVRMQERKVRRLESIESGRETEPEESVRKRSENVERPEEGQSNAFGTVLNGYRFQVPKPVFSGGTFPVSESGESEKFPRESRQPETLTFMGQVSVSNSENLASVANESERSDTESADHGSTDKSSVSKLTNEKQSKKVALGGLFGSFKLGRGKGKAADGNGPGINSDTFETAVKEEEPEEIQIEGTRPEGIVYAELDMARSPGNVMRREDEKTEYAEIMYPPGKLTGEKIADEVRKSRENLVSSRENLAESEEVFTVTVTPDGKKEAAV